jgi:GrpB-like predicted nucleotidyltransferase (UPF0157 family)
VSSMPNDTPNRSLGLEKGVLHVAPPNPEWPAAFLAEERRIRSFLGGRPLIIEHVGSTAVPGLWAKPILDMMASPPAGVSRVPYIEALVRAGYEHMGEYGMSGRDYFRLGIPRTHHLHMLELGGEDWRRHIAFRDYLRAHPEAAAEYSALKRRLADEYASNRPGYTDAKTAFVEAILAAAVRA